MPATGEVHSIVVAGAMNPRIHTPAWYRLVGLVDEDDYEFATASPSTVMNPIVAIVQFPDVQIACQADRWEVSTPKDAALDRLQSIAATVFDDLLNHTPVGAMGFNFSYKRTTRVEDIASLLAERLSVCALGSVPSGLVSGEMSVRRSVDDHSVTVIIRPSNDQDARSSIVVASNYDYRFNETGFFKIRDRIAERFPVDLQDAVDRTSLVIRTIEHSLG